ncbi:hypothetical protein P171DRAFT_429585 [Karstenula rhodostoma CBS 690.94]|uniref:Uncharacterized protein n=1 Tax=Karstenula rhodostoma CBS 690.94 TaxID=1392251 RepID=A0A9P4UFZ1_9PLEO|nr:hypothetical protein P171DRAFT_429585 [Karstenula rhodostoma CBS 690.94]
MSDTCPGNISSIPAYRPTTEPYVAIPNAYNWSSLLQYCCGSDHPVATWGEPGDDDKCYLYCNVTVTENHKVDIVRECVRNAIWKQNQTLRITTSSEDATAAAGAGRLEVWRGGVMGWVVLGIGLVGAVCGGL